MTATNKNTLSNQRKIAIAMLLCSLGKEYINIFNNFTYAEGESNDVYEHVIEKFDQVLRTKKTYEKNTLQLFKHGCKELTNR